MNATRAATIRLRAAFDGAVSLGRVQTPTLALVVRREQAIRAFVPEPYWLVEALFAATGERVYSGRYLGGKRIAEDEANGIVADCEGRTGHDHEAGEEGGAGGSAAPLRPHHAPAAREHALRLLRAPHSGGRAAALRGAQGDHLSAHELAFPDERHDRRDQADRRSRGQERAYARAAAYVTRLEKLPLGRVVNDKRVEDHHAIIPTRSEHDLSKMGPDEARIYDLVARRFLAVFHPDAVCERTRVETTVAEHVFRTSGRVLIEPGWKSVYGEEAQNGRKDEDDSGGDQLLPALQQGEEAETRSVDALRKETQPPRRYSEASLLWAMETAGKDIQDAELREAMKDSGIGTPATRAAIIERLLQVGYLEREGRALHATEKGIQVISLLGGHPLTSAELTGNWEHRLDLIEQGEDTRPAFMSDIVKFTPDTVAELDKLKGVKIERANLGPCPICGRDVIENRKGYSCWSKDDPGCGFVIWKKKANKILPVSVVRELMETRRTAKPVAGFKGRKGRRFSAKLRLEQGEDGKWRVEFDEEWANAPRDAENAPETANTSASAAS